MDADAGSLVIGVVAGWGSLIVFLVTGMVVKLVAKAMFRRAKEGVIQLVKDTMKESD